MRQRYGDLDEVEPRVVGDAASADPAPQPPKALRAALGVFAALCVATTLTHLVMVFLQVGPANPISERFGRQIHAWIHPWFDQSWYLFAPDPQSSNVQILARTTPTAAAKPMSGWFDISAADIDAVRHNPFPSHTAQNVLQTSWALYEESFDQNSQPTASTPIQENYLRNIAVQRVAAHDPRPFQQIQLRVITTLIPLPKGQRATPADSALPETVTLPWWKVTPNGR